MATKKQLNEIDGKTVITAMGIECSINPDALDDLGLFSDIRDFQNGDVFVFPRILKTMFGDEWASVEKQLPKNRAGRVSASGASEFMVAVIAELNAKN